MEIISRCTNHPDRMVDSYTVMRFFNDDEVIYGIKTEIHFNCGCVRIEYEECKVEINRIIDPGHEE